MLLTITNTQAPATDLGYLLHKNPARLQSFRLAFGEAHVFYPEVTEERCTAALLLDVDPVGLIRRGVRFAGSTSTSTTVRTLPPRCCLWSSRGGSTRHWEVVASECRSCPLLNCHLKRG